MDTYIWINYLEENNPLYTWSIGKVYFDHAVKSPSCSQLKCFDMKKIIGNGQVYAHLKAHL